MYNYSSFVSDETRYQAYNEKKSIHSLGVWAAVGILGYVLIQNAASIVLAFSPKLYDLYFNDPMFQSAVNIILSVMSMLIPFAIAGKAANRRFGTQVFAFDKPKNVPFAVTAVGFGVFVCLAGNYVTSIFVEAMDTVGIKLTAPEFAIPSGFFPRLVYAISLSVVPALTEEFAIRGAVMQPLRRYGDKFAIIASSLVFAVLHGNLIQAPFAFIAGIGLGYAVCVTGSIWTGVAIHFINNLHSVITEFIIEDIADPQKLNTAYYMVAGVLYVLSIACSIVFFASKERKENSHVRFVALPKKNMWAAYLLNLPMIAALLIMLYVTAQYVEFK